MLLALAVAVAADGLQLLLAAVGWFGADQAIDCVAMVLVSRIIGFHILLLPTFVVELVPLLDDLPTWTACTAAVIALASAPAGTINVMVKVTAISVAGRTVTGRFGSPAAESRV